MTWVVSLLVLWNIELWSSSPFLLPLVKKTKKKAHRASLREKPYQTSCWYSCSLLTSSPALVLFKNEATFSPGAPRSISHSRCGEVRHCHSSTGSCSSKLQSKSISALLGHPNLRKYIALRLVGRLASRDNGGNPVPSRLWLNLVTSSQIPITTMSLPQGIVLKHLQVTLVNRSGHFHWVLCYWELLL